MYPTYEHILKVYKDQTLTPSQKMHEIFKNSKTQPLQKWLDQDIFKTDLSSKQIQIDPSLKIDQAEVVEVNADGQILTFRYPDNTYYFIDAGIYTEIEDVDHISFHSFDEEIINSYLEDLLSKEPLTFARGFFVDEDLEDFFTNSYPEMI